MDGKKILKSVTPLSVKLGIGCGECALLHVGGVFDWAEFFTIGDALSDALHCEGDALGGDIIVSSNVFKWVTDNFEGELLESGNYKIKGKIGETVPSW